MVVRGAVAQVPLTQDCAVDPRFEKLDQLWKQTSRHEVGLIAECPFDSLVNFSMRECSCSSETQIRLSAVEVASYEILNVAFALEIRPDRSIRVLDLGTLWRRDFRNVLGDVSFEFGAYDVH